MEPWATRCACVRAHCTVSVPHVNPRNAVLAVFEYGIDLLEAARNTGSDRPIDLRGMDREASPHVFDPRPLSGLKIARDTATCRHR